MKLRLRKNPSLHVGMSKDTTGKSIAFFYGIVNCCNDIALRIADRKLLFAQSVNSNDRKSRMQVARRMESGYNGSREQQENETEKARNEYVYIRGFKADHEDAARGGRLSVGPGTGS